MTEDRYFTYNIFGLILNSEIELDELTHSSNPDFQVLLRMKSAKHPFNEFKKKHEKKIMFKQRKNIFCLVLKDIVEYLVLKENDQVYINMEVLDPNKMPIIKSWLFGSVFSAVLIMQGKFALHASAIKIGQNCVLFCGTSGIGKSTLATQLHTRGFPIYSDDKCVFERSLNSQKFRLLPSLRITRLWDNSLNFLDDQSFISKPEKIVGKGGKYQFLLNEKNDHELEINLSKIYVILNTKESNEIFIKEVLGSMKALVLRNQTHRYNYVKGFKMLNAHSEYINEIANEIRIFRVFRPMNTPINEFVDFMEEQIKIS